jgi:transcriptional regulator with XRE-family HTH domain
MAADDGAQLRTRLGRMVAARRVHLGLSVAKAAELADINRLTWSRVENGSNEPADFTYGRVERALQWKPGGILRWLEDQTEPEPIKVNEPAVPERVVISDPDLLRYVSIMNDPKLTATQRRNMQQQLRLWADMIDEQLAAQEGRRRAS